MSLLVIDDEIDQVETLRRGLRRKGYRVIGALNAEEALAHLENRGSEIDLVLTDYAMPGKNGIELLKIIRERRRSLPVIVMSAYVGKALAAEAFLHRCDSFIEKPFTLDRLVREVERVRAKLSVAKTTDEEETFAETRK